MINITDDISMDVFSHLVYLDNLVSDIVIKKYNDVILRVISKTRGEIIVFIGPSHNSPYFDYNTLFTIFKKMYMLSVAALLDEYHYGLLRSLHEVTVMGRCYSVTKLLDRPIYKNVMKLPRKTIDSINMKH